MTALAWSVFIASLLGSLHCAGMCGGFVVQYAGAPGRRDGASVAHVVYNLGRLIAYAILGAVAGAIGATLDRGGALLGVQRVAGAVAGAFIVIWGTMALLESVGRRVPRVSAPSWIRSCMARALRAAGRWSPASRAFTVGLLTGCLPCGWLYAFVVTAGGTGLAVTGAAVMIVFWIGTLPAMVTLGIGVQRLAGPLRRYVPTACAVAMIVLGLWTVAGRVITSPVAPTHHDHTTDHAAR